MNIQINGLWLSVSIKMLDATEKPKFLWSLQNVQLETTNLAIIHSNTKSNGNQIVLHIFLHCSWKVWELIVSRYQIHERIKNYGGIGFETSLLLTKPKKDPTFQGRYNYQWEHFCITVYSCIMHIYVMHRFWIHPVFRPWFFGLRTCIKFFFALISDSKQNFNGGFG